MWRYSKRYCYQVIAIVVLLVSAASSTSTEEVERTSTSKLKRQRWKLPPRQLSLRHQHLPRPMAA